MPSITGQIQSRDGQGSNFNRSAVIQQTKSDISELEGQGTMDQRAQSPDVVVMMAQSAAGSDAVSL